MSLLNQEMKIQIQLSFVINLQPILSLKIINKNKKNKEQSRLEMHYDFIYEDTRKEVDNYFSFEL